MRWLQNWRQPPDMFGFVSLTEYRNRQSKTRKYETLCENRFKVGQIEIDDKFKEITTLNTPMGLLRWSRLPFGIKTANHIFQRAIEKILLGKVDNIIIYQDDICMGARTREELKSKTEQVLRRQAGMTINWDKCKLDCEKISYQGYQISREGISPDERLTNKTAKMEKPTNKKELESFWGLIDFYGRYLPRYSELIEPFVEMRKKNVEFTWTQKKIRLSKH